MVNIIPTIIFDVLLVGAAVALFGAVIRSALPGGEGAYGCQQPLVPFVAPAGVSRSGRIAP